MESLTKENLIIKQWNSWTAFVSLFLSSIHSSKLAFIKHGNYEYHFTFSFSWFAPFLLFLFFFFMFLFVGLPFVLLTWRPWPLVLLAFFQSLATTSALRFFPLPFFLLFLFFFQALALFCLLRWSTSYVRQSRGGNFYKEMVSSIALSNKI